MIPQCGEPSQEGPELGYGTERDWLQLFGSGLISGTDESTPVRIERFGEFEIPQL